MKITHLLGIALLGASSLSLAAGHGGQGQGHGQDKAHKGMHMLQPMPNLMRVVQHHGDQLNLTKEQSANLAKWRELNHDKVHSRMREILAIKKALQVAALKGANLAAINVYVTKMDRIRAEIIAAKIACRNNMRNVLNDEQWEKLKSIYSEEFL
jgi:Spy/CpxP family protein refolding chaperone